MLNPNRNRRALTRRTTLLALLPATAAVGIVAALRPAVQAAPTVPRPSTFPAQAAPVSAPVPNPKAAIVRLHKIYGFLQIYRQTHNATFPVHTTTLMEDMTLNPKRYGLPDQGLGNQTQTLHFFTSPDSRFMDGHYSADQIIVYYTHSKRPDKTLVGTAKPAGMRDVFAYTGLFVRNHPHKPAGFYLVLWDDGTVSRISVSSILTVPVYDLIGPARLVDKTTRPPIKQIAFPGQAGLPHG